MLERRSNGVMMSIFALFNLVFAPFFSDRRVSVPVDIRVFGFETASYSPKTLRIAKDFYGSLKIYLQKEKVRPAFRWTRIAKTSQLKDSASIP